MKCPHCHFENPEGLRFCLQCAVEFALPCPRCGFDNPLDFHYCGRCGSLLVPARAILPDELTDQQFCGHCGGPVLKQAAAEPIPASAVRDLVSKILVSDQYLEGERRNITVLFADLSSFTLLAEQLDPEEIYLAVDLYLRAMVEEVQRYGGFVDKYTGDGLMVLFGAPTAHENDPERAIRAALTMQQRLHQMAQANVWSAPVALQARIGINSGTAVVGRVGPDFAPEYTALGDVVNVAARLEKLAEPGAILVSHNTFLLTQPLFEFEKMGPIPVRGRQEPVDTYRVVSERKRPGLLPGKRALRAPLINRKEELSYLKAFARQLDEQRQGGLILVVGEGGIGKSRLIAEWLLTLPSGQANFLVTEAASYGRPASYSIFSQFLHRYFQIAEDEEPAAASQKMIKRLKALDITLFDIARPYLLNLLDLPDTGEGSAPLATIKPAELRQYTFLAVRSLLTHVAAQEPLILIIEDVQWLDEASLDLLIFLLRSPEPIPLLLCCTSRPAAGPALDKLEETARQSLPEQYHRLDLGPLSPVDNLALLRALPGWPGLSEAVERQIVSKAQGNPLYTEELLGLWLDRGFVQADGGWQAGGEPNPTGTAVPVTLERPIMARVDSLGTQARHILQCAAVLGQRFSLTTLRQLMNDTAPDLDILLKLMEQRGIIQVAAGKTAAEYEFRQSLTRDSVYNSLLFRRRKQLHREVATILEKVQAKGRTGAAEVIAYHYGHSDEPTRAVPFLLRAAERSRRRFASVSAIALYGQALSLMVGLDESWTSSRIEAHIGLGEVYSLTGNYPAASVDFQAALALLSSPDAPGDPEQVAAVCARLGHVYQGQGDFAEAGRWLEKGLAALDEAGTPKQTVGRAQIFSEKGWSDSLRGLNESGLRWLTQAVSVLEQLDQPAELASAYNRLGVVYFKLGQMPAAQTYFQKGVLLRQQINDLDGLARSYNNLAATSFSLLNWEQAVSYLRSSLELHRKTGYVEGIIDAQHNLAIIHLARGDLSNGRKKLKVALDAARSLGNPRQVALILSDLGEHDILRGNLTDALAYLNEARQIALEAGVREAAAEAQWRLAWAYVQMGDLEEAWPHANEAVELAAASGIQELLGDALRTLGVVQGRYGQYEAAEHSLQSSIQALQETGQSFKAARGQLELGRIYSDWGRAGPSLNGHSQKARDLCQAALAVFVAVGARPGEEAARATLAELPA